MALDIGGGARGAQHPAAPAPLVTRTDFRDALDTLTAHSLRPLSAVLGVLYVAHAVVYGFGGDRGLCLLSAFTAGFYGVMWLQASNWERVRAHVVPLSLAIGLAAGGNCVAGLFFGHAQQSALLVILAIMAVSLFARATRLFAVLVGAMATAWCVTAVLTVPAAVWSDELVPLASAVVMACCAHVIGLRSERRLAETRAELQLAAAVDELTGAYNRRGFLLVGEQLLRQAIASNLPVTLLFADVDRMKHINDSRGHAAGDATLRTLARILRAGCRDADIVGRLGGDEFCVLMLGSQEGPAAARVRAMVDARNVTEEHPLLVSIGEVHYRAPGDESLQSLIARGDAEMYAEKARRRVA